MNRSNQKIYSYPVAKVIDAALRVVTDLRYKIDNVDRQNGIVSFKTGMSLFSWGQEVSILVVEDGPDKCSVDIGNKLKVGIQMPGGEAARLRTKIFGLIDQKLLAV
jgi:hypothetical protein